MATKKTTKPKKPPTKKNGQIASLDELLHAMPAFKSPTHIVRSVIDALAQSADASVAGDCFSEETAGIAAAILYEASTWDEAEWAAVLTQAAEAKEGRAA